MVIQPQSHGFIYRGSFPSSSESFFVRASESVCLQRYLMHGFTCALTADWRLNGWTLDFFSPRTREIGTNASDTPMYMHDAFNDSGRRFFLDVFCLAGILDIINHCNDYDTTLFRWNTTKYCVNLIKYRPLEYVMVWPFSIPKSQFWRGIQLFWYNDADQSCKCGRDVFVQMYRSHAIETKIWYFWKVAFTSKRGKTKRRKKKNGEEGDKRRDKEQERRWGARNVIRTG